jgi:hypothetical protein
MKCATIKVIVVAIGDEDVVFEGGKDCGHPVKIATSLLL